MGGRRQGTPSAFGVEAAWEDRFTRYQRTAEVRCEEFGAHAGDQPVPDNEPSR